MRKKTKGPKIKYVAWRDGRPRFVPARGLRERGFVGKDLQHPDGRWFSAGEALDWSRAFVAGLDGSSVPPQPKPAPEAPSAPPSTYPLSRLFEQWLKSPRILSLAPKTVQDYRQKSRVIETHDPDLWASEVTSLEQAICYGLYEELWTERGLATARGALVVLGIAIKWGMKTGRVRLPVNPARDLDMSTPAPRARFLTKTEFLALVEAAEQDMRRPDLADMFYAGVWTAQRQADRLSLQASAVRDGRFVLRQAKTGAIVNAPVAPELKKRWKAAAERRREKAVVSPYVHLNESTWAPWNHWTYRQLFSQARAIAATRVPSLKTVQEKDFRATGVTWMALTNKIQLPQICAVSGHSLQGANIILRHYLALHPDMATTAIGEMVKWYEAGGNTDLAV